nr:MAG TPA: hypothetical protein [Caudoviricetes sp.]
MIPTTCNRNSNNPLIVGYIFILFFYNKNLKINSL